MSVTKHKAVKHSGRTKKSPAYSSLLTRYPRLFLAIGLLLLLTGVLLLSVGYVGNAKIGLAMMAFFIGICLVLFSRSPSPKIKQR
ncbi:hypothetical protein [Psychromonas sp. MME2]|uniref:hypothetical protein n=1 Tax=unclassified Psychromonas TaxID=2614957 RepID=UPI00339C63F4